MDDGDDSRYYYYSSDAAQQAANCPYCSNHGGGGGGDMASNASERRCPWHSGHRTLRYRGRRQRLAASESDRDPSSRFHSWSAAAAATEFEDEYDGNEWDMASSSSGTGTRSRWRWRWEGGDGGHLRAAGASVYLVPVEESGDRWRWSSSRPWQWQSEAEGNRYGDVHGNGGPQQQPTWQNFMQDMLQSFLLHRNNNRRRTMDDLPRLHDHGYSSDPGDYLEDPRGFQRLLFDLAENDESRDHGPPPASASAIDSLPSVSIKQTHLDLDDSASCPVCKEQMQLHDLAKELPCLHLYHESCIIPWLKVRNTCPVCRYELPTDDADYEARKRANNPSNNNFDRPPESGIDNNNNNNTEENLSSPDLDLSNGGSDIERRHYPHLTVIRHSDPGYYNYDLYDDDESSTDSSGSSWLWFAARIMGIFLVLTLGTRLIAPRSRRNLPDINARSVPPRTVQIIEAKIPIEDSRNHIHNIVPVMNQ